MNTSIADTDIVNRARNGDHRAFRILVDHYKDLVYRFSFHVCRDQSYAEETMQDTFVNAFRKLGQFDGQSKFSTWLYSIVTNSCLMRRRRTKLEASSIPIEEATSEWSPAASMHLHAHSTPLEVTASNELRDALDRAIARLPVDYRLVFVLRDIEGQSAEETATILNITVPAVKSRLHRARAFLRQQLQEYVEQ
jgi:RNA polymerase sigma-70 factor (ECF subfamily)